MKKTLSILISSLLVVGLSGCGAKTEPATAPTAQVKKTLVLGATPVPAGEILKEAKPLLEKKGYTVEIKEFTDYIMPNTALNEKQLDANLFQHTPYLEKFNKEKGTDLVPVKKIYLPPIGVYSKKVTKLEDLKDGAVVAVPNDPTNEKRALKLLEQAGLIKVKDGETVSALDITENKKNLVIKELEAAQLPRSLEDVDAACINANFAMEVGLKPNKDSIYLEPTDSPYSNVIAVRSEDKDKNFVKDLAEVLSSPEIKKFIEYKYQGSVIPTF
jgi:D-methionine transport system substrate-binding protein